MAPSVNAVRSKKRRILVLMHEDLVPPASIDDYSPQEALEFKTEHNVMTALQASGHDVHALGLSDELAPLRKAIEKFKPHVVFNLLEEFRGKTVYDYHMVGYLEMNQVPYTGCNPRGLLIARDKALSKKILHYHRIRVPRFATFPRQRKVRRPKSLKFPLIVKSQVEEASQGIAQSSVVHSDDALIERVEFIHRTVHTDAIVEQYIPGRELYVAVLGNHRLTVFPTWELILSGLPDDAPKIATRKVKWDLAYQKKHQIDDVRADIGPDLEKQIVRVSKRIYRRLGLDGYVRIDFRLAEDGKLYFLEANPNPDISDNGEFAGAAGTAGLDYQQLLGRIVSLGIRRA
jgi:D-alanine-D-alanine ligase